MYLTVPVQLQGVIKGLLFKPGYKQILQLIYYYCVVCYTTIGLIFMTDWIFDVLFNYLRSASVRTGL
jgi:hypothetical protein